MMTARLIDDRALSPRSVVAYLDRYVIGQDKAKRSVAVALRNRLRRRALPDDLRVEVVPKNILMIGPTGVGKTEIARRMAKLVDAPFVKVEATKFTQVGYVGRDVESMIRDLVETAVQMIRMRRVEEMQEPARARAEERILDALLPGRRPVRKGVDDLMRFFGMGSDGAPDAETQEEPREDGARTREKMREMLRAGKLDAREVEIEIEEQSNVGMGFVGGMEEMGLNFGEMIGGILPKKKHRKQMKIDEAMRIVAAEEAAKLVDMDQVGRDAIAKAEEEGIIFIDEIDKIAGTNAGSGPDVSREGVQRDLLPVIEGTTVQTKYGLVHTDHILFIAAGAFHKSKPSDLAPELQGRLPIRVELSPLSRGDLVRILTEPENSLVKQYIALIGTEGVELHFEPDAIDAVAECAAKMNDQMEDIGARRLHAMMEQLLEDVSFSAGDPDAPADSVVIDSAFVRERLDGLASDSDARRYLL